MTFSKKVPRNLLIMLFNSPKNVDFAGFLFFTNIFVFFGGELGLRMYQMCKLRIRPVFAKMQGFERLFKHCFCLLEDDLWSKF